MKTRSRMMHLSRWLLAGTAAVVLCLPAEDLQVATAHELPVLRLAEVNGANSGQFDSLRPSNSQTSWNGLLAAARW